MSRRHILVIEDDPKTSATVELYLSHAGFKVSRAFNGSEGLNRAERGDVDLIVLDLMLPGMDGLEICRRLRKTGASVPIIMVTARSTEDDRIAGLDLGADDYLVKPFSPRELTARVRAVLRRLGKDSEDLLSFDGLEIDSARKRVILDSLPLSLTPTEFRILWAMAGSPGRVFSRDDLIERVFDRDFSGTDRTVDVHVTNLRKKIETDRTNPRFIHTVFGMGYKFTGGRGDL